MAFGRNQEAACTAYKRQVERRRGEARAGRGDVVQHRANAQFLLALFFVPSSLSFFRGSRTTQSRWDGVTLGVCMRRANPFGRTGFQHLKGSAGLHLEFVCKCKKPQKCGWSKNRWM